MRNVEGVETLGLQYVPEERETVAPELGAALNGEFLIHGRELKPGKQGPQCAGALIGCMRARMANLRNRLCRNDAAHPILLSVANTRESAKNNKESGDDQRSEHTPSSETEIAR